MGPLLDLSHPIAPGMTVHPGIPAPEVRAYRTRAELAPHYAPGVSFELTWLGMVTSIGTYVDAPAHRHEGLADLAQVPLERYADLPEQGFRFHAAPLAEAGGLVMPVRAYAVLDS